jgi:hypothetical protein
MSNLDIPKSNGQLFSQNMVLVAGILIVNAPANFGVCSQVLGIKRSVVGGVASQSVMPRLTFLPGTAGADPANNAAVAQRWCLQNTATNADTSTYTIYWTNNVASTALSCPDNPFLKLSPC